MVKEFELTNCQVNAIKKTSEWFNSKHRKSIFVIGGAAGTGKSTIIKYITNELNITDKTVFVSFTGKATLVLKQKGLSNCSTIHKLIYIPEVDEDTGKVTFRLKKRYELSNIKLIVADESSMVSPKLLEDLKSFNIPLLFLGDSAQLPPLAQSESIFDNPDIELKEITRQAKGDPIIYISQEIIKGNKLKLGKYGDSVLVTNKFSDNLLIRADQVICNTNKKKLYLNKLIRKIKGYNPQEVQIGDKVICRKNNWDLSEKDEILNEDIFMLNGLQFNIDSEITQKEFSYFDSVLKKNRYDDVYTSDLKSIGFDTIFKQVQYSYDALQNASTEHKRIFSLGINMLHYAYALNTHVVQGSEWDNIVYFSDDAFGDKLLQSKLKYTGVTRCKKKLIYIQ